MVLYDKIEGHFIGKLDAMTRCMMGLKCWSNQPNAKMLKVAEGNGDVKRKNIGKHWERSQNEWSH